MADSVCGCIKDFLVALVGALATMAAAYYGAKKAFDFQNKIKNEELAKANIASANDAIVTMQLMINKIFDYQKRVIDPIRNSKHIAIDIRPYVPLLDIGLNFNHGNLIFLIAENNSLLFESIVRTGIKYSRTSQLINGLTEELLRTDQDAFKRLILNNANNGIDPLASKEEIEHYQGIKDFAGTVINYVDAFILDCTKVRDEFVAAVKHSFPNGSVVDLSNLRDR